MFIIGDVVLAITALPGYQSNVTRPLVAVWRVANTALGVVVEVAAVSLVLPVTARCCRHRRCAASAGCPAHLPAVPAVPCQLSRQERPFPLNSVPPSLA